MAEDKGTEPVDEGMEVVPDAPLADVPTIIPELEDVVSQLATDVSFARKTWKDGSEGATPITAAELNRLEKGVSDLTSTVNALRDSVSQCVRVPGASSSIIDYSEVHDNFVINMQKRFTGPSGTEYKAVNIIFENNGCRVSACRADNGEWGPIA